MVTITATLAGMAYKLEYQQVTSKSERSVLGRFNLGRVSLPCAGNGEDRQVILHHGWE